MKSKLKSILVLTALWAVLIFLSLLLQFLFDDIKSLSVNFKEQLNTFLYGVAVLLIALYLQSLSKFPKLFDTKWLVLHLILAIFSYFAFQGIFVDSFLLPEQGASFTIKESSIGNSFIDKILGNGFGIYALALLLFSAVKRDSIKKTTSVTTNPEYFDKIKVKLKNRTYFVPVEDIHLIKSSNNYCDLHTPDGVHVIRQSLGDLELHLNPKEFVRIHRSTIIRVEKIEEFVSDNGDLLIELKDYGRFNVSNKYRKSIVERFDL